MVGEEDDRDLWQRVVESINPIKSNKLKKPIPKKTASKSKSGKDMNTKKTRVVGATDFVQPDRQDVNPKNLKPLELGDVSVLDGNNAKRFRAGNIDIEATLDLHGLNQQQAQNALEAFLTSCQASSKRCVLVITGKGSRAGGESVLKQKLPIWMNLPHNRSKVVSIAPAKRQHGGSGAVYVWLRRVRG